MPRSTIRVLVVDDSPLLRRAIGDAVGDHSDMTVVGIARDGNEAIVKFRDLKPDVVTLDIQMPGKNGQQVLEEILEIAPTPVIMVSSLTQQGQRTLSCLHDKDLGQEFVAPAGHFRFALDALFSGVAFEQSDGEAS